MLPDLTASLALMYNELVEESSHSFNVDKSNFFIANTCYQAIVRELSCSPNINNLNGYLNELLSMLPSCAHITLTPTDTLLLQCNSNTDKVTWWVSDETECEGSSFSIYATITSFTVPDLVSGYNDGQIEIVLLAESNGHKQLIQVEKSFTDINPLSGVYYWNASTSSYVPINKISEWSSTIVNKSGTDYTQYAYTGPNRGTSKTKFIF